MPENANALVALAAAVWIGAIVFQSFVVAPSVFAVLDKSGARRVLRKLFPRFYRLGLGCGTLMIVALAFGARARDWPALYGWMLGAAMLMTVLAAVSLALVPRINTARDAGDDGSDRFKRLHALSVAMILVVLALGIGVVATLSRGSLAV